MAKSIEPWLSIFQKAVSRWEVVITPEIADCFEVYLQELKVWNEKINLTALQEPKHIALGHFADSLAPMTIDHVFEAKHVRAVDIGTGAGFPGIPLKIINPNWHMTLVDSTIKKCDFLRAVVGAMELNRVDIVPKRSEEVGLEKNHRESYDFAFARALSSLSTLIEYALPLLKVGGYLVAHRGRTAADEASRVNMALDELGGVISGVHHYDIPEIGELVRWSLSEKFGPPPSIIRAAPASPRKGPYKWIWILCFVIDVPLTRQRPF